MNRFVIKISVCVACFIVWNFAAVYADEYQLRPITDPPPADALSEAIAQEIPSTGWRVVGDGDRTVAELWFRKLVPVDPEFQPTSEVLYPFAPGELMGVLRFPRRGYDFRDQTIGRGVYTLRYAQQPVDGNHVGTSPTRDFLTMVSAADDQAAAPLGGKELQERSAAAAGSNHPAILLLRPISAETGERPGIFHDEEQDWWILRLSVTGVPASGGQTRDVPIDLVVVGHASE